MQKTVYEDYKYCLQDTSFLYVGCKYTLEELISEDEIPFKFRLLVERYILPESDWQDTMETHLYYLDEKSFLVKIYAQIKAKVKINIIEEKRTLTGAARKHYVTKMLTVEQLAKMSVADKEAKGVVIQELKVSKLALQVF